MAMPPPPLVHPGPPMAGGVPMHAAAMPAMTGIEFGPGPMRTTCPACGADVITNITYVFGVLAWVLTIVFFVFCLLICLLIPLCVNDCKDVLHSCPNCNSVLGRHKRC